ncbi:tegument protein pp65 [Aotine betaherpesvirus 1]|uniref:Tegument protein pp65 n=1 Tax=Aotine betaherpesvirus 1 TaxID=50290 RepID=G8XUE9_9BETA|nr:tegument protein pp65 [Aotine betaherpesvirus 1]AEV80779.1 tegument protein pp65 [Aotine betaherpesvirus 1]
METRQGRRRHEAGEYVQTIGPISGHILKAIFNGADTLIKPQEMKQLSTGIDVKVAVPAVIFASHFTPDSDRDHDRTGLTCQHTAFYSSEVKNLKVNVWNNSDRVQSTRKDPFSIYVYALPLSPVKINQLYLFAASASDKKKLSCPVPEADTTIQKIGFQWSVRLVVSKLVWTRGRNETSNFHTTCFVFDPLDIPIAQIDGGCDLVCSDDSCVITKLQLTRENKVKVYVESSKTEDPPSRLFCHILLQKYDADIVMNRNPKPGMRQHGMNGLAILAPNKIIVKPGKVSHVCLDATFRCPGDKNYIGLIVPKCLPGLGISSNFLHPGQHVFLELRVLGDGPVEIETGEELGNLHFVESSMIMHKSPGFYSFVDQYHVEAKLEYDHVWDQARESSGVEGSGPSHRGGPMAAGLAAAYAAGPADDSDQDSSDDDYRAMKGECPRADTDDDSSDDDDERQPCQNAVLAWPCWKAGILTAHLPPIVAQATGPRLKPHRFFWSENQTYRIFFQLIGEWSTVLQAKRRRQTAGSEPSASSLTVVPSVKKRHRF